MRITSCIPRRLAALLPLFVLALLAISTRPALAQDFERYYQVRMSDAPAGWMRSTQRTADGVVTTTSEMTLKVKRGPINLDLTMSSEFVESAEGNPISMKSVQKMGSTPITSTSIFGPSELVTTTEQAGRTSTVRKPLPKGDWLAPAAAARYAQRKLADGETSIQLSTIDPMTGPDPVKMVRRVLGRESLLINGKPVPVTKTTVDMSAMPGVPSVEFVDDQGLPVKSETTMGGLQMSLVASGPEVVNAAPGELADVMVSTLVKPDRPIPHPRVTRSASYIVSDPSGKPPEFATTAVQTVTPIDEHSARVTVDLAKPSPAATDDLHNPEFTGSSALIDPTDEQIKKLAARATAKLKAVRPENQGDAGGEVATKASTLERAEAIRKAVYRHIKNKSLGVGFASASETVRSREGDCTEHGVLLAAALRADGIPARVVAGVVYVDEFVGQQAVFGYHMWAQALIEVDGVSRWIDLDAILSERQSFDATHLAMSVSSLADDHPQTSLVNLAGSIGTLKIKVESVQ